MRAMVRRAKSPGLLAKYLPHLEYLLIDEQRYDLTELAGMKNLVAAAICFERPDRAAALVDSKTRPRLVGGRFARAVRHSRERRRRGYPSHP